MIKGTIGMKKLFLIFCITLTILFSKANVIQANDFAENTANTRIAASLYMLNDLGQRDVIALLKGQNATGKPIRIMFRNLAIYGAGDCEAFTTKTKAGSLVIFINEEHKDAPLEAIACLIAHESQHHTMTNTKQEELRAWLKEVSTWNAFVRKDPLVANSTHPLIKRENKIAKLNAKDNGRGGAIEQVIAQNPVYAGLN